MRPSNGYNVVALRSLPDSVNTWPRISLVDRSPYLDTEILINESYGIQSADSESVGRVNK